MSAADQITAHARQRAETRYTGSRETVERLAYQLSYLETVIETMGREDLTPQEFAGRYLQEESNDAA
ncbi:hypothetical protein [Arhodomonas sp. AD133]|uniref:hypothetical protein n=1 Tax=Arhodomonas sp. AD133 TaxID=3415009 RepID=UPI003EB69B9E